MNAILASASPRRRELIKKLEYLSVTVRPSAVEERTCGVTAESIAVELAAMKAESVASDYPGELVVGADTVVSCGGRIYGKPGSEREAKKYLRELSGKTHEVITGLALVKNGKTVTASETTRVTFAPFDEELVEKYVKTGKPLDKAGAYGAQDPEIRPMIERVDGDEDNVIGLPVRLLDKLIKENYAD